MSCTWTQCDGNHARCAVLLACLDQVPLFLEDGGDWYRSQKWCEDHGYHWNHGENAWDVAEQVADRLLDWLRWPGEPKSHEWCDREPQCAVCGLGLQVLQVVDRSQLDELAVCRTHPLDGTDVAGLRQAFVHSGPLEPGCSKVLAGRGPDWPAVAVVADYLSWCGGWLWVHDRRGPVAAKTLPPIQNGVGVRVDAWLAPGTSYLMSGTWHVAPDVAERLRATAQSLEGHP